MKLGITMLIHNKDDVEFVTEFPCFLGHPVGAMVQPWSLICESNQGAYCESNQFITISIKNVLHLRLFWIIIYLIYDFLEPMKTHTKPLKVFFSRKGRLL